MEENKTPKAKREYPAWLGTLGQNLANLIDVKTFITLGLVGTLIVLAINQNIEIPSEMFAAVISSIITYFFTKKVDEKKG